jgi:hypothetical protein
MNKKDKREALHRKLEIMRRCYQARNMANFDAFFDTFFDRNDLPIIIGTDTGPWFHTMEQIRWLIAYDWEHWGDLEIDSWNFTVSESEDHDIVRAKAILDFGQDRAWDVDIVMIFAKMNKKYFCRLMQFKVPRNEIRPVVVLNRSEKEQTRSRQEMNEIMKINGDLSTDLLRDHLAGSIRAMMREQKPYLTKVEVRKELIYMEESREGFLFALTGFCLHRELNAFMPFRIIGIGRGYGLLDVEFSHPFTSELG